MKTVIVAIAFVILNTCANKDGNDFANFVNSFPTEENINTTSFDKLVQTEKPMTKAEALKYVYPNEPGRLMCEEITFDLETEKSLDTTTSEFLPSKILKKKTPSGYIIGFTRHVCHGERNMIEVQLVLVSIDNNHVSKDTLIAYQGNEFTASTGGLISPATNILLVTKNNQRKFFATVFQLDPQTAKFKQVKPDKPVSNSPTDYFSIINNFGWEFDFISNK